jgi:hypothetical protein
MTAAMAADGVEVTDQGAVQAWIDDFNALPEEGRIERVPVLASLPGGPAPTSAGDKRRAKTAAKAKKRERHARRRNRR